MRFDLIDRVIECTGTRIVTVKNVTMAEEYLADHFPTFPVLPGVLMLEAMAQAGRRWLESNGEGSGLPWVLGRARAVKYGRFIRPGDVMRVEVEAGKREDGTVEFKGQVLMTCPQGTSGEGSCVAASGRFSMRRARVPAPGSER